MNLKTMDRTEAKEQNAGSYIPAIICIIAFAALIFSTFYEMIFFIGVVIFFIFLMKGFVWALYYEDKEITAYKNQLDNEIKQHKKK